MKVCVKCEKCSKGCFYTVKNFHMVKLCQIVELYNNFEKSFIKMGGFLIELFAEVFLKFEKFSKMTKYHFQQSVYDSAFLFALLSDGKSIESVPIGNEQGLRGQISRFS